MKIKNFKIWDKRRDALIKGYVEKGKSLRALALKFKTTAPTIAKYLSRLAVPRRSGLNRRRGGPDGRLKKNRDYTGQQFGQLTVIMRHPLLYPTHWIVKCTCGRVLQLLEKQLLKKTCCGHGRRKNPHV